MKALDGLTILVTGANGFLGKHLLARLSQARTNLHAVSRSGHSEGNNIRWWHGSVANPSWIRDLMARVNPDITYQLASASMGGQDPELVLPTFENDLRTTVNTLVAAREVGCRRVIITRSLDEPSTDCRTKAPSSPYAAAKAACGLYGRMFHQLYGVPVVMLRPFMTYGPGQKDHKLIPYTIQSMLKGQSPALASGTRSVDWVYVDDVITAFVAAATTPQAVGLEIDLGSGSLVAISAIVEQIRRLIPGAPDATFGSLPDRINEQARLADMKTAQAILHWKPITSLGSGLSRTIEWYRQRLRQSGSTKDGQSV
jgi:UDP-glucose 4-epimerase